MKLLLDIGNSRIKWAILVRGALERSGAEHYRDHASEAFFAGLLRDLPKPRAVFAANVAGNVIAANVGAACAGLWSLTPEFVEVQRKRFGLINAYTDFKQLGVDRWLAIVAAWMKYKKPVCVVDCGTALTIDGVDGGGNHVGGWIIPGIELMERVLMDHTRGIAAAGSSPPVSEFGRSTAACLRNGSAAALAALIDHAAVLMATAHGDDLRCIMTGGAAGSVLPLVRHRFEQDPELVLRGLALVTEEI